MEGFLVLSIFFSSVVIRSHETMVIRPAWFFIDVRHSSVRINPNFAEKYAALIICTKTKGSNLMITIEHYVED